MDRIYSTIFIFAQNTPSIPFSARDFDVIIFQIVYKKCFKYGIILYWEARRYA